MSVRRRAEHDLVAVGLLHRLSTLSLPFPEEVRLRLDRSEFPEEMSPPARGDKIETDPGSLLVRTAGMKAPSGSRFGASNGSVVLRVC
jgi:hypothetical protein